MANTKRMFRKIKYNLRSNWTAIALRLRLVKFTTKVKGSLQVSLRKVNTYTMADIHKAGTKFKVNQ